MAITNFTGGHSGKQTETLEQQLCSVGSTSEMHKQLIFISAFNIVLSITAFLGNSLILVALRKESSLHPPSKLLFRCLATTDLCVGLIFQPLAVTCWISMVYEDLSLCRYLFVSYFITGYTLCVVSLLTMSAISVDRLLALLLGLRYRLVVTLKRTYVIVVTFWVMSIVAAMSYLKNPNITVWYGHIFTSLCLVISIISYTKIFVTLRHRQNQVQDNVQQAESSQAIPLNIARYRKAVSSALWVQLTLVVCYLPYGIVTFLLNSRLSSSNFLAWLFTSTLVYFNSSLNPFLYCWKINELKQAVKETIRQVFCCS